MGFFITILCIVSILLQQVFILLLFHAVLSLWQVSIVYSMAITAILSVVQFCLGPGIMNIFFNTPVSNEEEKEKLKNHQSRLAETFEGRRKIPIRVFSDDIPVILSMGGFFLSPRIVVSSGLIELIEEKQLGILINRELEIAEKGSTKLFTTALFVPFILHGLSAWFLESASMLRQKRGSTASYFASLIFGKLNRFYEFLILHISRIRHQSGDNSIEDRESFRKSLETIGTEFIKPVACGPPFRKRVYEGLGPLLPFDFRQAQKLKIWQLFLENRKQQAEIYKTGRDLHRYNRYWKYETLISSHPEIKKRFFESEKIDGNNDIISEKIRLLSRDTGRDRLMDSMPSAFFVSTAVLAFVTRSFMGFPFLLWGLALIYRQLYFRQNANSQKKEGSINHQRLEIEGKLVSFRIPGILESPWYFLEGEKGITAVILKQMARSEEPLMRFAGYEAKARGVFRIGTIPYLDISQITSALENSRPLLSGHAFLQILAGLFLIIMGILMLLIQYSPVFYSPATY